LLSLQRHRAFLKDIRKITFTNAQYAKYIDCVSNLLNEDRLPSECKDHSLTGKFNRFREFHIGGDLVVIYRVENKTLQLIRIGSHNQLFR